MSARRTKRIRETNAEYEAAVEQVSQQKVLTILKNDDLFTVDRAGSSSKRRKVQEEIIPKESGKFVSKTEKHLIEKHVQRLRAGQTRKAYGSDSYETKSGNKKVASNVRDIWGEDDEEKDSDAKQGRPHKHSLKIALPGQSYNPTQEDHQDTLAQAVSIHLKKIEDAKTAFDLIEEQVKQAKKDNALVLAGESDDEEDDDDSSDEKRVNPRIKVDGEKLKAMTAVILDEDLSEDDEDDSEDEEEEANDNADSVAATKKIRQKVVTKAQKNKRRARRQAEHEARLEAVEKKKSLDIIVVKHIKKALAKEESEFKEQRKIRDTLEIERKRAEEEEKTKRLRTYEVNAVPLTDELQGSLRSMKPKGAPSFDAMQSMIASGETRAAFARKRRAYEKPHGAKRVKWIAKYKV